MKKDSFLARKILTNKKISFTCPLFQTIKMDY